MTQESSDDEEDYEMPPEEPPAIPSHKSTKTKEPPCVQPPSVPSHKNHSENNLVSSSDEEEEGCPDYTDPESFLDKPPVPLYDGRRRKSHFQPSEYMPCAAIAPMIEEDDDMLMNSTYVDPATTFTYTPAAVLRKDGKDTEEEIYSDGQ